MQLNEEIRDKEVRVISADGEQLGIMSAKEALKKAEEKNLDLVKIAPQAQLPCARLWTTESTDLSRRRKRRSRRKTSV